jgi:hypothetical protein
VPSPWHHIKCPEQPLAAPLHSCSLSLLALWKAIRTVNVTKSSLKILMCSFLHPLSGVHSEVNQNNQNFEPKII